MGIAQADRSGSLGHSDRQGSDEGLKNPTTYAYDDVLKHIWWHGLALGVYRRFAPTCADSSFVGD
jgi:hypothetical protein